VAREQGGWQLQLQFPAELPISIFSMAELIPPSESSPPPIAAITRSSSTDSNASAGGGDWPSILSKFRELSSSGARAADDESAAEAEQALECVVDHIAGATTDAPLDILDYTHVLRFLLNPLYLSQRVAQWSEKQRAKLFATWWNAFQRKASSTQRKDKQQASWICGHEHLYFGVSLSLLIDALIQSRSQEEEEQFTDATTGALSKTQMILLMTLEKLLFSAHSSEFELLLSLFLCPDCCPKFSIDNLSTSTLQSRHKTTSTATALTPAPAVSMAISARVDRSLFDRLCSLSDILASVLPLRSVPPAFQQADYQRALLKNVFQFLVSFVQTHATASAASGPVFRRLVGIFVALASNLVRRDEDLFSQFFLSFALACLAKYARPTQPLASSASHSVLIAILTGLTHDVAINFLREVLFHFPISSNYEKLHWQLLNTCAQLKVKRSQEKKGKFDSERKKDEDRPKKSSKEQRQKESEEQGVQRLLKTFKSSAVEEARQYGVDELDGFLLHIYAPAFLQRSVPASKSSSSSVRDLGTTSFSQIHFLLTNKFLLTRTLPINTLPVLLALIYHVSALFEWSEFLDSFPSALRLPKSLTSDSTVQSTSLDELLTTLTAPWSSAAFVNHSSAEKNDALFYALRFTLLCYYLHNDGLNDKTAVKAPQAVPSSSASTSSLAQRMAEEKQLMDDLMRHDESASKLDAEDLPANPSLPPIQASTFISHPCVSSLMSGVQLRLAASLPRIRHAGMKIAQLFSILIDENHPIDLADDNDSDEDDDEAGIDERSDELLGGHIPSGAVAVKNFRQLISQEEEMPKQSKSPFRSFDLRDDERVRNNKKNFPSTPLFSYYLVSVAFWHFCAVDICV
jgi:hypothetical protein